MALKTRTFILKNSMNLSPSVMQFSLVPKDGELASFKAGQFITLHLNNAEGKSQFRSYSLANSGQNPNQFDIAVAYIKGGMASEILFNLSPGSPLEISGPHGMFVLKAEQPKRYILVGTGTGISPYRSMLPELIANTEQNLYSVNIIQGVRQSEDLLYRDDFVSADQAQANFNFTACYSQAKTIQFPYEQIGRIQKSLLALMPNPANDIVYLCGNPAMIDDTYALLTEKGFDRSNLRREKYNFSH